MRKLEHIGGKAFGMNRKVHLMAKKKIKISSLCCHLHRLPKAKCGAARNNRRATLGTRQESVFSSLPTSSPWKRLRGRLYLWRFQQKNCFKIHRFLIDTRHHRKSEGSYLAVIYFKKTIYHASIPGGDTLLFGLYGYVSLFRVYNFVILHLEQVSFEAGIL